MSQVFNFLSENAILSAIVSSAIISAVVWVVRFAHTACQKTKIHKFLVDSAQLTGHRFRSTQAISAATKITESRVEQLCQLHPKIRRSGAEKQVWTLID